MEFRTLARLAVTYTYFCGLMFLDQRDLGEGLLPRSAGLAITLTALATILEFPSVVQCLVRVDGVMWDYRGVQEGGETDGSYFPHI